MKMRTGFVSNSSSTSFVIENKTDTEKTLEDFAKEAVERFDWFFDHYHSRKPTDEEYEEYYRVAGKEGVIWNPKQRKEVVFGDTRGDVLNTAFDYALRKGGGTESFRWEFKESLR